MTFPIYFRKAVSVPVPDTRSFLPYILDPSGQADGALPSPWVASTFEVDGVEIKNIPLGAADNFAILEGSEVNQIVRARIDYEYGEEAGVVAKADAFSNPASYLKAYYINNDATYCRAVLEKYVNGVKTELINDWTNTPYSGGGGAPAASHWLEIRVSGTTVQLFQNNEQVGTDQTVADDEITGNTKCGMYLNDTVSRILRFYCGKTGLRYAGAFGSSLTATTNPSGATGSFNNLNEDYPWNYVNQARSGHWPFSNLMRLYDELLAGTAPEIVFCDFRIVNAWDYYALEAIIRRIWELNYRTRIISPIFPGTSDPSTNIVLPQDQVELDNIRLANHYGVYLVDLRADIINRVASGDPLSDYMADQIHLTTLGYALGTELQDALIVDRDLLSPDDHRVLPAPLFDTDLYWTISTIQHVDGADNDGETGTGWADVGTNGRESSTAGDTITFIATFREFGLYSAGTPNTVCDVQIDGGAWEESRYITQNGYYGGVLPDGNHTIVIRVRSGVPIRIDQFWAI